MQYSKGFSLIEVLISLMLISTIIFCLTEQQLATLTTTQQLIHRAEGSQFLDQFEEMLIIGNKKPPPVPSPHQLKIQQQANLLSLELNWAQESLRREYLVQG